jgi:hypothetical protein
VRAIPDAVQLGDFGDPAGMPSLGLDRDWLLDRVCEGLGAAEIARRTEGLTPYAVRRYLKRYGIAEPNGAGRHRARARELDDEIRRTATLIERAWVALAEKLFEMHERNLWRDLDFSSFSAYLESLELSRSHCVRLVRIYRVFVSRGA